MNEQDIDREILRGLKLRFPDILAGRMPKTEHAPGSLEWKVGDHTFVAVPEKDGDTLR